MIILRCLALALFASAVSAQTPEVQKISGAYSALNALQTTGTITGHFDVAKEKRDFSNQFQSAWQRGKGFRNEVKDDLVVGGAGEKLYSYRPVQKVYQDVDSLDSITGALWSQNPSLLLAQKPDALGQGTIVAQKNEVIGGKDCVALQVTRPGEPAVVMYFDSQTHLLRQVRADYRADLEKRGTPDVKQANVTIDYVSTETAAKPQEFAWSPPPGFREAHSAAGGDANDLVGKSAPELALKDLQGKAFVLSAHRGHVVVLDFWATWCGPCVEAMPHLNQIYEQNREKGLEVFAVNQQESADDIKSFLGGKKFSLSVVLDPDGAAGGRYNVEGIPQTVIIGKDGVIKKIFVGFDEQGITQAIDNALEK